MVPSRSPLNAPTAYLIGTRVALLVVMFAYGLEIALADGAPDAATRPAATNELPLSLAGKHRYRGKDDARFAAADLDDRTWQSVRIPGSVRQQGLSSRGLVVWYRIHFSVPESLAATELGVDLGCVMRADETFLNGVRIGGEGVIRGRHGLPSAYPPPIHRVYALPRELLRYGGDNVLAIRVSGMFGDQGIAARDPRIDRLDKLSRQAMRDERWSWATESFLMGIDVMTLLFCLFMYVLGIRDRELKWFAATVLTYTVGGGFEERIPYALGWLTPATQTASFLVGSCGVVFLLEFFADALRIRLWPLVRWLQGLTVATGVASCVLFWSSAVTWHHVAETAWLLCWAASGVVLCTLTARGLWKRIPEAKPLAVGLMFVVTGTWLAILAPYSQVVMLGGVRAFEFVVRGFLVCCAFAVVQRYARTRARLEHANRRLLEAHEEERRRLSRDIHDGLGQSLNALKLRIDMLQLDGATSPDSLVELSQEARAVIAEARQISRGLRPVMLEHSGLVETLRWYADRLGQRTRLKIQVTATGPIAIPLESQDHLFRICQEAMRNTIQHAAARRLTLRFETRADRLKVAIEDDGRGFDASAVAAGSHGLGLRSIIERCELLGGSARITSRPGAGTTIRIEIPRTS